MWFVRIMVFISFFLLLTIDWNAIISSRGQTKYISMFLFQTGPCATFVIPVIHRKPPRIFSNYNFYGPLLPLCTSEQEPGWKEWEKSFCTFQWRLINCLQLFFYTEVFILPKKEPLKSFNWQKIWVRWTPTCAEHACSYVVQSHT